MRPPDCGATEPKVGGWRVKGLTGVIGLAWGISKIQKLHARPALSNQGNLREYQSQIHIDMAQPMLLLGLLIIIAII